SYTYFAWRNTSWELTQYFNELSQPPVREYFRPNLWTNTPDILTEYLQNGGRSAFAARFLLAATLGASYGIYGPAFELCESRAREAGSEEYLDSEKYQLRGWNLDSSESLRELITLVNKVRRENPALQQDRGLRFHPTENDQLVAYTKATEDLSEVVLTDVNVEQQHSVDPNLVSPATKDKDVAPITTPENGPLKHSVGPNPVSPATKDAATNHSPRRKKFSEPYRLDHDPVWFKDAIIYELNVRA